MIAIDLFSGCGGSATGVVQADVNVIWSGDSWQEAVDCHQRNHPSAIHVCQDLCDIDWSYVPDHDVQCASPPCTGHSRARGKERGHHDASRSVAWSVIACARVKRPSMIVVENVPEFSKWEHYNAWIAALRAMRYSVGDKPTIINAADVGVPQNRRRAFIIASLSRSPITLPKPSFEHVPASKIIRFDKGMWADINHPGRANSTLERISAGRKTHGDRFLIGYYGSEIGGRSIHSPLGTLTTHDRFAIVDGDRMRMLSVDEIRDGMGFPQNYWLPASRKLATHLLGNAVCPPVMRYVLKTLQSIA